MKENTSSKILVLKRFRINFRLFKGFASCWKYFILVTIFPTGLRDPFQNMLGSLRVLLDVLKIEVFSTEMKWGKKLQFSLTL